MNFSFIKLIALLTVFSLISCELDSEDQPNTNGDGINIGTFSLAFGTVPNFVYSNKKEAIFVDTTGKELHLFISEEPITQRRLFLSVPASGTTPAANYNYLTERKSYLMKNDSFDVRFTMQIETRPFTNSPTSGLVADVLFVFHPNLSDVSQQVFYFELDRRTWPISYNPANEGPKTIFGRTFPDAYGPLATILSPPTKVLFNKEHGIISFTDELENKWRFERFVN